MGPTNFETAKKESPNSLRALYGSSMTCNATHGSDSVSSAVRELNFYFSQEQTLALLKPDAVQMNKANEIINRIANEQFNILEFNKLKLTKDKAQAFYAEHKGKGFYDELVNFMIS
eukprot:293806_1